MGFEDIKHLEKSEVRERADFILRRLGLELADLGDKDVLDIGAGDAAVARAALEQGIDSVTSFAASSPDNVKQEDIVYVEGDAAFLPFNDESFDLVIAHAAPPALLVDGRERIKIIISEIKRVLRGGGEARFGPAGMLGDALPDSIFTDEEERTFDVEQRVERVHKASLDLLKEIDPGIVEVDGEEVNFYVFRKVNGEDV